MTGRVFRLFWLDDEAKLDGSGGSWPAIVTTLVDPRLATVDDDSFRLTSRGEDTASFCEVFFASSFGRAVGAIRSLPGDGLDCAILDVRLKNVTSTTNDDAIRSYLEAQGCSTARDTGSLGGYRTDLWLTFWLYREISQRFPSCPVLFYTNYDQLAEEAGLRPFMNPVGQLSPAIYAKNDDRALTRRVALILMEYRRHHLRRLSPRFIRQLVSALGEIDSANGLLEFLTQTTIEGGSGTVTFAALYPDVALFAQQGVGARVSEDRDAIVGELESYVPNLCTAYVRFCRPSVYDWSSTDSCGLKTMRQLGFEGLGDVDSDRSPFELVTHASSQNSPALEGAWRAGLGLALTQVDEFAMFSAPALTAVKRAVEIASSLPFPVRGIPEELERLKDQLRWSPASIAEALANEYSAQTVGTAVHEKVYGCTQSVRSGCLRIAEDLRTNRGVSKLWCATHESVHARPIYIGIWGETGGLAQIPLSRSNKIREAVQYLKGFFRWYQFGFGSAKWLWFELGHEDWERIEMPTTATTLLRAVEELGVPVIGHWLVAEDYPPEKRASPT